MVRGKFSKEKEGGGDTGRVEKIKKWEGGGRELPGGLEITF